MGGFTRYPDPPRLESLSDDDRESFSLWWGDVVQELEQRDGLSFFGAANVSVYTVTSALNSRALPASVSATVTATHDVLSTLINDLQSKGIIA
jgi:hypothetical protein